MPRFGPRTLEIEPGGVLIIRKDRPDRSDLGRVGLVGLGMACLVVLLAVALASPLAPTSRVRWSGTQVGLLGGAMALILASAPAAIRATYRRSVLGRWRIDAEGVEYRGEDGDHRSLAWGDVVRAGWYAATVRLVGRDTRITLQPEGIPAGDWRQVRDRVEAALTPRFDLTVAPPEAGSGCTWRVLVATPIAAASVLASFGLVLLDPGRWGAAVLGGWTLFLGTAMTSLFALIIRDDYRRTWRTPRPATPPKTAPGPEIV